ncbi:hypothetical protein [Zobellia uliginosa]|uniref:hypothetical protein n=1 Tax=Zobellia uliginosa TaxID=143224 RepID=UPI0026E1C752|nr:hypothetical protein [Zobellia uliginosa]MDO6517749.1 hypothetical protein [Zobellia uliginosa]
MACHYSSQLRSDHLLTEKIEAEFSSGKNISDLGKIDDFEWTELLILAPYTSIDAVESELDLNLEPLGEHAIEHLDSIYLLVFLNHSKPVKIAEVSIRIGGFTNPGQIIGRNRAQFTKTQSGSNQLIEQGKF